MIRPIRTMTACIALALALVSIFPQPVRADDAAGAVPANTGSTRPVRVDFHKILLAPGSFTPAPGPSFADTTPAAPAANGKAGWSTAKKTWLIIGIVVGVGAIAVAVSDNHGGGSSGGGGGGY